LYSYERSNEAPYEQIGSFALAVGGDASDFPSSRYDTQLSVGIISLSYPIRTKMEFVALQSQLWLERLFSNVDMVLRKKSRRE